METTCELSTFRTRSAASKFKNTHEIDMKKCGKISERLLKVSFKICDVIEAISENTIIKRQKLG